MGGLNIGLSTMIAVNAKAVHYKNDLRRLTATIGAALALFGALIMAIVAYAGISANQAAVQRERQLVENALDQSGSRVLDQQKAIAWWDDAVIHAQMRPVDTEWLETNVGVYFNETYGHDEILTIDNSAANTNANEAAGLEAPVQPFRLEKPRAASDSPSRPLPRSSHPVFSQWRN